MFNIFAAKGTDERTCQTQNDGLVKNANISFTRRYLTLTLVCRFVVADWFDGDAYSGSVRSTRVRSSDAWQSSGHDHDRTTARRHQQPSVISQRRGRSSTLLSQQRFKGRGKKGITAVRHL